MSIACFCLGVEEVQAAWVGPHAAPLADGRLEPGRGAQVDLLVADA